MRLRTRLREVLIRRQLNDLFAGIKNGLFSGVGDRIGQIVPFEVRTPGEAVWKNLGTMKDLNYLFAKRRFPDSFRFFTGKNRKSDKLNPTVKFNLCFHNRIDVAI